MHRISVFGWLLAQNTIILAVKRKQREGMREKRQMKISQKDQTTKDMELNIKVGGQGVGEGRRRRNN